MPFPKPITETTSSHLNKLISWRFPYLMWDILGYIGAFAIIYYTDLTSGIIYVTLFTIYNALNIFFNIHTITIEYLNDKMPRYYDLSWYERVTLFDRRYLLLTGTEVSTATHRQLFDESYMQLDISFYMGNNRFIRTILYWIYFLGITQKNFSHLTPEEFRVMPS